MTTKLILNTNEILKKGSTGTKVKQLQEILAELNLNPGSIDGIFGNQTVTAVQQFQKKAGLTADGIVEPTTQNSLNQAIDQPKVAPETTPIIAKGSALYGGLSGKVPLPGVALIKEFEGFFAKAYPDPLSGGKPITIGWGTTRKKNGGEWYLGETITREEADELLIYQLDSSYLPPMLKIPVWNELNANQQGALLSFGYNLGANFYGNDNFASITRVLKNKQWDQIEETFIKYRNPGSNVEQGLKRRRIAEAKLFLQPIN